MKLKNSLKILVLLALSYQTHAANSGEISSCGQNTQKLVVVNPEK